MKMIKLKNHFDNILDTDYLKTEENNIINE